MKKTKLKLRPNSFEVANTRIKQHRLLRVAFTFFLPLLFISSVVYCVDLFPPQAPEVSPSNKTGHGSNESSLAKLERDVKDLKLTADFRAVKLRWSYEHSSANEPASFDVRYCELTSWDIEIKCRHRDLKVANRRATTSGHDENSVISKKLHPTDTVHQLDGPTGGRYEGQIFDLRALTNYTFQVRVSRFSHEPELLVSNSNNNNTIKELNQLEHRRNRGQAARKLLTADELESRDLRKIETKPFGAEATKCLADVSEVVVNTGRYFGGRISVEDSSDPRCNLIGNKSSEQTSYLFRIDHEICDSKVVDGNRIETMVLVHENKDILTHNTARFLILCNFLQKSFTLRASISLPKINGVVASQTRPAVITSLPRKPFDNNNVTEEQPQSVLLGSMPGVYRARTAQSFGSSQQQSNNNSELPLPAPNERNVTTHLKQDVNRSPSAVTNHNVDELETNTIEKFIEKKNSPRSSGQQQSTTLNEAEPILGNSNGIGSGGDAISNNNHLVERQSKQLNGAHSGSVRRSSTANIVESQRARSLALSSFDGAAGANINKLPQPVQVQSKLLFVERSNPARVGRQQYNGPATTLQLQLQQPQQANLVERAPTSSQIDTLESRTSSATLAPTTTSSPPTSKPALTGEKDSLAASRNSKQLASKQQAPFIRQREDAAEISNSDLQQQQPSILMTNNHRIPGDYLSLAQAVAAATNVRLQNSDSQNAANNNSFSIKYSGAKVDEYPVGQAAEGDIPLLELAGNINSNSSSYNQLKARSGRMRPIIEDELGALSRSRSKLGSAWTVDNRMGEMLSNSGELAANNTPIVTQQHQQPQQPQADLLGETSNTEFSGDLQPAGATPMVNATLSNITNITNYLLKWSLKKLTNLARKSLESLVNQNGSDVLLAMNKSEFATDEGEQQDYEQRSEPATEPLRLNQQTDQAPAKQQLPVHESVSSKKLAQLQPLKNATTSDSHNANNGIVPARTALVESSTTKRPLTETPDNSKVSEEILDGFITSATKRAEETPRATTLQPALASALNSQQHQKQHHNHNSRPSNYSKSLDLNRVGAESTSHRLRNSEKNNVTKVNLSKQHRNNNQQQQSIEERQDQPMHQESAWTNRDTFYSSWMFYSLLLFIALVTGIFFTFWLVSVPLRDSKSNVRGTTERRLNNHGNGDLGANYADQYIQSQQRAVFNNSIISRSSLNSNNGVAVTAESCSNNNNLCNNNLNSPRSRSLHDVSYQKYDYNKFENYSHDVITNSPTLNNNNNNIIHSNPNPNRNQNQNSNVNVRMVNDNNMNKSSNCDSNSPITVRKQIIDRDDQQSHSSTSQRTRSTSAGSTIMVDENDCKNNEFLYTEHVLINPGLSFGESFA